MKNIFLGGYMSFRRKARPPKLMQSGLNDMRIKLNQEDLFLEQRYPVINDFLDGGYPLNKVFCIRFGDYPDEIFFDHISENAVANKTDMKPFKRRRL